MMNVELQLRLPAQREPSAKLVLSESRDSGSSDEQKLPSIEEEKEDEGPPIKQMQPAPVFVHHSSSKLNIVDPEYDIDLTPLDVDERADDTEQLHASLQNPKYFRQAVLKPCLGPPRIIFNPDEPGVEQLNLTVKDCRAKPARPGRQHRE